MSYSIENLKKMNFKELNDLAKQIRKDMIDVLQHTGGHLSSNLGVVELTIALHYVFNSPKDFLLFDVSHQTYTHKMLTGRFEQFKNLRKYNGLSGFASRKESCHDILEAGHSSTSISAALGYLEAKNTYPDLFDNIVVVIGDASICNGLSLEALNYLGAKPNQKMIIVLNDNEMGISKNKGGLAKTFNKIRLKGQFKIIRKMIPSSIKLALKKIAYKNTLFSDLGLKYLGPIDGHNIKELVSYLEYAKTKKESVILHVHTKKGKGFVFSEEDRTGIWHSTPPFNAISGHQKESSECSFGEEIAKFLVEKTNDLPHIRIITPGMSYGSGLDFYEQMQPQNFIDVGIAEENALMMASSMADAKLLPIVFMYSTFLQRGYDEIIHDIARGNNHVVICLDRCGVVSSDGPTHQGVYDVAFLNTIPNINIMSASSISEALDLLDFAMENKENPYVLRYAKNGPLGKRKKIESTKWEVLKESSNQTYFITYGALTNEILTKLQNEKIGLINARFIKPIDEELIKQLAKNNKLIFIEEVCENNNLASVVLSFLNRLKIENLLNDYFLKSYSIPNIYLPVGKRAELLLEFGLNIDEIIAKWR